MSFKRPALSVPLELGKKEVEVNQRHLIEKILARYPSEFIVYRELMQNSDDAKSSKVEIRFETTDPDVNKNILEDEIIIILFKNNGFPFKRHDWERIKTIAVGNPDEQKIGAFGVGFYSLFSVCDDPIVMSDGKVMNFYWVDDRLFTEYGEIEDEDRYWTTFAMHLRKPEKFPNVEEFSRFLTNSLEFTRNLLEVTVYFNNILVICLSKELQEAKPIDITSEYNTYSPNQMFQLTSLNIGNIQMDVKRLSVPKESSKKQSLIPDYQETSIVLKIATGNLKITAENEFSEEMKRLTKKEKLPNDTPIQMIFFDGEYNKRISPIFKDLLPYPEQGRIYIGFSTHQTIGCCSNLSALVIPSVERESIDLVNKTLKEYNIGILSLAGVLCRIFYENEMSKIKKDYKEVVDIDLENHAAHVLRYFTFNKSTPKKSVSKTIEERFFNCLKRELPILSTCGVLPITEVRMPNPKMESFINKVPIISKIVLKHCKTFFEKDKVIGLIKELSFQDVLFELKSRSLSEIEMIALLKWWISYSSEKNNIKSDEIKQYEFTQFMQLAKVCIRNKFRPLNTIRYILNPKLIPSDVEIPDDALPYSISKNFDNSEMKEYFQWVELPLINWAEFIVEHYDFDLEDSRAFAEKVHKIIASGLNMMTENYKDKIHQLFVDKSCIPTTHGMKRPEEAYFKNVNLPLDLPVVQFQEFFDFQNLMITLGVNKVIKIDDMMNLISNEENLDHMQIAKYFGSISDLDHDYLEKLRTEKIWPAANLQNNKIKRFVASDLHTPLDLHRELCLPIIEWTEEWDHNTKEAKFLIEVGLLEYPSLIKILEMAAPLNESEIRNRALKYFIKNFEKKYSYEYDAAKINIAFLPCSKLGVYAKPLECFINSDCAIMGFNVIHENYRDQVGKLGVRQHPGQEKLIERLIGNTPQTENKAKEIFEYLETQKDAFNKSELCTLGVSEFIPIRNNEDAIIHKSPCDCFFKSQGTMEESMGGFFSFIDFGEKANKFLQQCGVKNEPSAIKIAELLVESPESSRKVWESIGNNVEKYKFILQKLANDFNTIKDNSDLFTKMKEAPILLGVSEGKKYNLDSVENIYINDDAIYIEVYRDILAVPEDYPKFLYKGLGCKSLSESIEEKVEVLIGNTRETDSTRELQSKLKKGAHFFYNDYPKHVIKRDKEWIEKLKVIETDKIEIKYSLKTKNKDKTLPTTACIEDIEGKGSTLYMTPKQDYLDISKCLVKYIYKSHKLRDIKYLAVMLKTSINDDDFNNLSIDSKQENGINKQENSNKMNIYQDSTIYNPQLDDLFKSLSAMFMDCEHNYIRQCLEEEKENKLIRVEKKLMKGNYPKIKIPVNPYDPPVTVKTGKTFMNVIQISRHNLGSYLNKDQLIHCDIIKDYSLQFDRFLDGIEFHIKKDIEKSEIFPEHQDSLDRFVNLLKDLIKVFECAPKFIHIFYDNSNLMAFNQDHKLFFNFKIYLDLYKTKTEPAVDAMTYWYMVICHELAHKLVAEHNSEYSHHLSSLAAKYMKNLLEIMNRNKKILVKNYTLCACYI